MRVEVEVCAVCVKAGKTAQALQRSVQGYTVRAEDGRTSGEVKLCTEHGAAFEGLLPGKAGRKPQTDPGPSIVTGLVKTAPPAKKTAAKKTAAKKAAPARRGPVKKTSPRKAAKTAAAPAAQPEPATA